MIDKLQNTIAEMFLLCPSSVPKFLFASIKGLSKTNLRFVWLPLFFLEMIYKYDDKFLF